MKFLIATVALAVTAVALTEPQGKLGFLQDETHTHALKSFFNGYELEDASAPLIPETISDGLEGDSSPFSKTNTEWKKDSDLPLVVQWGLAITWILMLASLPFIVPIIDGKEVTKTQMTVGGLMLVVLFGGFYLFTQIILFQSIHFKTIRPLTVVECIYFMAQVITTVGYGDITPAKIRGQVFVGLYVIGALFIIAMVISDLTSYMIIMAREYKEKLAAEKHAGHSANDRKSLSVAQLISPQKPSVQPLLIALGIFVGLDACWVMFFTLHPGEAKTVFEAIYMSVITLSSVGLGAFTPVTEGGMIFGAFWMLFGCGALVNVITSFTELMVKLNEWERFKPESKAAEVEELKGLVNGSDEVTQAQFLQFSLLQMKCVSKEELAHIQQAFANLQPENGSISLKSVQDTLAIDEAPASAEKTMAILYGYSAK